MVSHLFWHINRAVAVIRGRNPCLTSSKRFLLRMAAIAFLFVMAGCGHEPGKAANAVYPARRGVYPRSVAILPFTDLTGTPGIAEAVRFAFYGRMSTLSFVDVEIGVIDDTLRRHRITGPNALTKTTVKALGRMLGCDAVVLGNVYEFRKVFAGLYSSMNVGVSIQIWDTRTGQLVWSDRNTARIQDGGLPLTIIDLPMITLRSGWNLRDTVKRHAIDEACGYLVRRIPTPGSVARSAPSAAYTLQIGAFSSKERALSMKSRFKGEGFPAFIRRSRDDRGGWHRVLIGPYQNLDTALDVQRKLRENYRTDSLLSKKHL